ncbi:MAG TPA: hypothetical protein VE988_16660 [Gemmataceae bacterium]|nr:hypothetical protein [Gemmataceae bacterium]
MALTKLALACALMLTGQAPGDVVFTNRLSGKIPSAIDPQRAAEFKELRLHVSADQGRTWQEVDRITPDKDGFRYSVPSDGQYWYHVVVINQQGRQEPADLYKTPPTMKLVVDTKPPELKITSAQRQGDELVVSWSVKEDNPDPQKLKLEYRTADSSIWTPIPLTPGPTGTAKTKVNMPGPLVVRLQFRDLANNQAQAEVQVQGNLATTALYTPPAGPDQTPVIPQGPPGGAPSAPNGLPAPPPDLHPASGPGLPQVPTAPSPKMPVIASSNDFSQGSPVPIAGQNAAIQRGMPELQILNEPEIVLEYEVSKVGPSGLAKIEVWITRDGGTNWSRFAEDPDANQATSGGKYKRTLMLPGEGVYGISLLVKSKAGMGRAVPRAGDVPEMLVEVDTTPPEAMLMPLIPDPQRQGTVLLSWNAKDRNLAALPISLEWADRPQGPWQTIAANLPNSGRHPWVLPSSLPSHVYLRLTARDNAGNVAVAVTRDPQLVDLSEPEGRLLRVMPANKR